VRNLTLAAVAAAILATTACSSGDTPRTTPDEDNHPSQTAVIDTNTADTTDTADARFDEFCQNMAGVERSDLEWRDSFHDLDPVYAATSIDDPDALASLWAWGAEATSIAGDMIAYLEGARAAVDDPEIAAKLDTAISVYMPYLSADAEAATSATDVSGYYTPEGTDYGEEGDEVFDDVLDQAGMAFNDAKTYAFLNCDPAGGPYSDPGY
jgi:hypothetical protein